MYRKTCKFSLKPNFEHQDCFQQKLNKMMVEIRKIYFRLLSPCSLPWNYNDGKQNSNTNTDLDLAVHSFKTNSFSSNSRQNYCLQSFTNQFCRRKFVVWNSLHPDLVDPDLEGNSCWFSKFSRKMLMMLNHYNFWGCVYYFLLCTMVLATPLGLSQSSNQKGQISTCTIFWLSLLWAWHFSA